MNVYVRTLEESTKIRDAGYIYLTYMKLLSAVSLRTLRSWNNQPIYVNPLHAEFVAGTIGFVGDKSQRDTRLGKLKWSPVSTLTESKNKKKSMDLSIKLTGVEQWRDISRFQRTPHTHMYIYIYACSEPKVHTVLQFRWLGSLYCSLKNSVLCAFHLCSFFAQLKLAP